jgi:hypothetical protein
MGPRVVEASSSFVKEGKLDVLMSLIMALVWAARMVSYVRANQRSQTPKTSMWRRIECTAEVAVLVIGMGALVTALACNGLHPISVTNVIAVSVAIFISYTTLPKVIRNNKNSREVIEAICSKPRYKISETRYVENVNSTDRNRFEERKLTLAIEYMRSTLSNYSNSQWNYVYEWNGKVHIRNEDLTLLITDGQFDYRLFNMSGSRAQQILRDSEPSEHLLLAAHLLAGMVPKNWFYELSDVILRKCWEDQNTRYSVFSAKGNGYGIEVTIKPNVDDMYEWVNAMKKYTVEVIAVYLGEGNNGMLKANDMLELMNKVQDHIYEQCHNGFDDDRQAMNGVVRQCYAASGSITS